MSISSLLNQIKQGEIMLPAIQRNFVWPSERIFRLLDSIMRGYPIGTILLWETYGDIQYRTFINDYRSDIPQTYHDNSLGSKIRLVIDGQQRLQSLYVALYGTYEGCPLYFDILSGRDKDDVSEDKYIFTFSTNEEIQKSHDYVTEQLTKSEEDRDKDFEVFYYLKVSDLFNMSPEDRERLKDTLSKSLALNEVDRIRMSVNINLIDQMISTEGYILKETIIDQDLPSESSLRKSDHDVLEVFVRVNTENTRLSRSDLIFSMLKLNWKESATVLPDFIREINTGNYFGINNDFVIRCLLAVSDLGTKFDVSLLRKKSNVTKLRANFEKCCNAIRATIDFVKDQCWCESSEIIGNINTLIPFVYYLFHVKNHDVRNDQVLGMRKAFYLLGFAKPFSRYAESRVGAFIRDELRPLVINRDETFPWEIIFWWIRYWEGIKSFEDLLQSNYILALHLIQGSTGAAVKYERNTPEVDHIFPRSILRQKGFDRAIINHFANFWILAKSKNQNKSNRHPADYFIDVPNSEMKKALIDRKYLDYRRYTTFINHRTQCMVQAIIDKLGFCGDEFSSYGDD